MAEYGIRVLHLSDLHEGQPGVGESWRRRRVLGEAWERNLDHLARDGKPFDLVCFTGDAAFSGAAGQYAEADAFFRRVRERLGVPLERFFVVPGNHDVDQKREAAAWKRLRDQLTHGDAQALGSWMGGGKAPRGLQLKDRERVLERQAEYRRWVGEMLGRPELLPNAALHPHLGYRHTLALPGRPFSIHVIGLDTAWLCGDNYDAGRLWLTDHQIMAVATDQGRELSGLRLALMHHPATDLMDGAEARRRLAEHTDLVLRGHLHEAEPTLWQDPQRKLLEAAAGCLYDSDRYPNSFQVLDLTLNETGQLLRTDVWFRGWSSRGTHWYDDSSLYENSEGGRVTLWVVPPKPPPPTVPTDVFVGREWELEAMREALLPQSGPVRPVAVCAVQGMPGIGKSYLAARFAREHGEAFPGGVQTLVLGAAATATADSLLADLCGRLELPSGGAQAWERLQARLQRPATLVIVENVDDAPLAEAVAEFAGRLPGCALAVTGRYQGLGDTPGWRNVPVARLTDDLALAQLREELAEKAASYPETELRELVRALGGLPLAVHLAAGYLRAGLSPAGFVRRLREQGLAVPPVSKSDPRWQADRTRAVLGTSFELSREAFLRTLAEERVAEPERWWRAFCDLGHAPLVGFGPSLGAAVAGLEVDEFETLCFYGRRLSLLEAVEDEGRLPGSHRVHPLLAEWLRRWRTEGEARERLNDWFLERLPKPPNDLPDDAPHPWKEIHAEHPALVEWLDGASDVLLPMILSAGYTFAMLCGPFSVWVRLCVRALGLVSDASARSKLYWLLGQGTLRIGDLDGTLQAAASKAEIDRAIGDERGAALAAGLLAQVLHVRGELDEAVQIHRERCLPVYERLGMVREGAKAWGRIADVMKIQRRLKEALEIYQGKCLPAFEQAGDARERAVTWGRIADVLQARGELDEALRIRRDEELRVHERMGNMREQALVWGKIADVLQMRGELDEALRIRRQEELPVHERLGELREQALAWVKIADVLQAQGDLKEALRVYRDVSLPAFQRLGELETLAVTWSRVADVLFELDDALDEAIRIYRDECVPAFEKLGAPGGIILSLGNLSQYLLLRGQKGDREEACQLLIRARAEALRVNLPDAQQIAEFQRRAGFEVEPAE